VSEALGNRPGPEQLLVLHAALDEPGVALTAWERWRAAVDLDDADAGTVRLLPLVYRNLGPDSLGPEDSKRLKDIYRESWGHNQLLFKRAAEVVVLLERAGIETLVLKGASLAALSYRDAGARPMDDVDVLVPLVRARAAIEALGAAGWIPAHDDPDAWTQVHHSLGYSGARGGELDLHWFALWQPARDEGLWRAARPFELAGAVTRAPCAADQLLLTCVHGVPWSPMPPFRWIADAVAVIRSAGDTLDWDRLAAEAERRRLTVALGAALAYLREEFDAPVPPSLPARLESVSAPRHERAAFRASCEPDRPTRTLRMAWDRYRRLRDLDTGAPAPRSFLSFARRFWGLDSVWKLPLHGARSLYKR
jgi:hypothetical protein